MWTGAYYIKCSLRFLLVFSFRFRSFVGYSACGYAKIASENAVFVGTKVLFSVSIDVCWDFMVSGTLYNPPPREEALQKSDIIQIANFSKNINSSHVRKYIFPLTQN